MNIHTKNCTSQNDDLNHNMRTYEKPTLVLLEMTATKSDTAGDTANAGGGAHKGQTGVNGYRGDAKQPGS